MKLYTYSRLRAETIPPVILDDTKNRWKAQITMAEARRKGRAKRPAIPFFHDRVPAQMVSRLFGEVNPYWALGAPFYEYTLDIGALKDIFFYVVDPAPLNHFVPGAPGTGQSYPEVWFKTVVVGKLLGSDTEDLKKVVSALVANGPMRKQIEALRSRPDFEVIESMQSLGLPQIFVQSMTSPLVPTAVNEV